MYMDTDTHIGSNVFGGKIVYFMLIVPCIADLY